jgi:hypothetical protein
MFNEIRHLYVEIKWQLDATDDFYCRSYCLLNMFRVPLCPSSGAEEYYTGGSCLWYLVLWFSSCRYGVLLRVMCPVCRNHLYNTLELMMMGIVVPETCWASNKICNKNHLLHLVCILFPHINDDARSKPHQRHFNLILIRDIPFCWIIRSLALFTHLCSPHHMPHIQPFSSSLTWSL